MISLHPVVICV